MASFDSISAAARGAVVTGYVDAGLVRRGTYNVQFLGFGEVLMRSRIMLLRHIQQRL